MSNQPGQWARPVPQDREVTQPPLYSAMGNAAGLAFVHAGSWEFSPRHFSVVAACIKVYVRQELKGESQVIYMQLVLNTHVF